MKNPILAAREKLGLSVKEMALMTKTVEVTVRTNENGDSVKITPKILNFLVDQGFDKEQLLKDYEAYKAWKIEEISKKMAQNR
ncbi:hypothetical protein ACIQXQ_20640 [Peribacillus sp. NPDC097198]|uniref:hypothetical protein n=1 Tax=Peribacillus sp. NPDC097198 TaxID=3364397 RepID=UPI0037F22066